MVDRLKTLLPHLAAILVFVGITTIYFYPQVEGKVIEQGDIVSHEAMKGEITEFKDKTGKTYNWNNSMFSGMPWGLLVYARDLNYTRKLVRFFRLGISRPIGYFIGAMIASYLVLVLLGVNPWLSALGAIAIGLNVNLMVLLEAGHNTKVQVIAFLPLVAGGMLLVLKKNELAGAIIYTLGLSLCIFLNHIQMVYYFGLLLGIFYLTNFVLSYKEVGLTNLLRKTGILLVGSLLAAGANSGQLISAKNYSDDTMRGAPILEKTENRDAKSSSEVKGLEWNYAMSWSNGTNDLLSLLVPRAVGGSSSEEVSPDTETGRLLRQSGSQTGSDGNFRAPMYWGDLPFTSGPYYAGSVVFLLFIISLFLLKPGLRYGFLAAFILCLLLSLGKNASWLNRTLFEYFPLFNKFRSPNSIMSLTAIVMIIPALLGFNELLKNGAGKKGLKGLYYAAGISGGVCALLLLFGPTLLSFTSEGDSRYQEAVVDIFKDTRISLMRSDALRSLMFVLLGGAAIWAYMKERLKSKVALLSILSALTVIDIWGVDRRYFDEDNFVAKREYAQNFQLRPVDKQIKQLEPKGRAYYRVLDLSINTFNSSMTSKHHNTIGGYNAAKLQRYQDMIDYHISKGNQGVLNMLNAKYIINQNGKMQVNPNALGNAWFVQNVTYVDSPNEEINALSNLNTAAEAVILKRDFADQLSGFQPGNGQGEINLVEYEPTRLVYKYDTPADQLAIFSEVWYGPNKGWEVTIDGEKVDMLRANYLLRALVVPAGSHEIIFTFKPRIPSTVRILSIGCSILILIGVAFGLYKAFQSFINAPEIAAAVDDPVIKVKDKKSGRVKSKSKRKK
jgi:hypothetical protein